MKRAPITVHNVLFSNVLNMLKKKTGPSDETKHIPHQIYDLELGEACTAQEKICFFH